MVVGDRRSRSAHVVVARYGHELRTIRDDLRARLRTLDHVGLGIGHNSLDLPAQYSALGIEILDRHHGTVQGRSVIGAHPSALGDGKADSDIICRRRLQTIALATTAIATPTNSAYSFCFASLLAASVPPVCPNSYMIQSGDLLLRSCGYEVARVSGAAGRAR